MSIDEQVADILAEGRRIREAWRDISFFITLAASWAVSADTRTVAMHILNSYMTREEMCFDGYDLALTSLAEPGQIGQRALEVIHRVQPTREI